jgi:hypothetical protein
MVIAWPGRVCAQHPFNKRAASSTGGTGIDELVVDFSGLLFWLPASVTFRAFKEDAKYAGAISKLSRYEAAIERSLYRALHELQRVQTARQDGKSPPSIAVDVTVDGLGPATGSDD